MHEPAPDTLGGGLVRVRLRLGYDGAAFSGWAVQPGLRTVQGVLEEALGVVLRLDDRPVTTCAGRTDAGVHARGQVVHVDVPRQALAVAAPVVARLVPRLRGVLPADVRVTAADLAPPGFDARFSALSRRYSYRVSDDPTGVDPLLRAYVLHHRRPVDASLMTAAAQDLLGEHDFAAFCRPRVGASTVRTLQRLTWSRGPDGLLVMDVEADAFCHSMVRALVGVLLPVGEGRRGPDWPAQVLRARRRDPAVTVVPPHGLVLEEVRYPDDPGLAARQQETRRVRG